MTVIKNPKAKGSSTPKTSTTARKKEVDLKALARIPQKLELSFGTYEVQDLDMYTILEVISLGFEAYLEISDQSPVQLLMKVSRDKELQEQISKIFATFCGEPDHTKFLKPKPTDFAKLIKTMKEVVNIDEIKEAFFEMGLGKLVTAAESTFTENQ